ncbi:hypothetical protein D3C72_1177090 [compost metagenome]
MVLATVSIERTAFMRSRLNTTFRAPASGVAPPHSPVLPPRGTTGTPSCWHNARQAATSAVVRGRTTACAWPLYKPRQSDNQGAMSASAV